MLPPRSSQISIAMNPERITWRRKNRRRMTLQSSVAPHLAVVLAIVRHQRQIRYLRMEDRLSLPGTPVVCYRLRHPEMKEKVQSWRVPLMILSK